MLNILSYMFSLFYVGCSNCFITLASCNICCVWLKSHHIRKGLESNALILLPHKIKCVCILVILDSLEVENEGLAADMVANAPLGSSISNGMVQVLYFSISLLFKLHVFPSCYVTKFRQTVLLYTAEGLDI